MRGHLLFSRPWYWVGWGEVAPVTFRILETYFVSSRASFAVLCFQRLTEYEFQLELKADLGLKFDFQAEFFFQYCMEMVSHQGCAVACILCSGIAACS